MGPPDQRQMEMLLDLMEMNKPLATGHARTNPDRVTWRAAWQEIASKLNAQGPSIKTGIQWAKFWKDKKGTVRRKSNFIQVLSASGGNAAAYEASLTHIDERIIPFLSPPEEKKSEEKPKLSTPKRSRSRSPSVSSPTSEKPKPKPKKIKKTIPKQVIKVEKLDDISDNPSNNAVSPAGSPRRQSTNSERKECNSDSSAGRSEMAILIDRMLACEERRAETDLIYANSLAAQTHSNIALASALRELADSIKMFINKDNPLAS